MEKVYLSSEENNFLDLILLDIEKFYRRFDKRAVLLFPPVNNFRRYLLHTSICHFNGLTSFSIGEGDARRVVICFEETLLRNKNYSMNAEAEDKINTNIICKGVFQSKISQSRNMPVVDSPVCMDMLNETAASNSDSAKKSNNGTKAKRPDLQFYVPRGRRSTDVTEIKGTRNSSPNVVTPRKKSNKSNISDETLSPACSSDIKEINIDESLKDLKEEESLETNPTCVTDTIEDNEEITTGEISKDEIAVESNSFESNLEHQEINIEGPLTEMNNDDESKKDASTNDEIISSSSDIINVKEPIKKIKNKNKTKTSENKTNNIDNKIEKLDVNECSWDMLFDDNGDCLDPSMMDELSKAVGDVKVTKPEGEYSGYETAHEILLAEKDYSHVVEIHGFPAEFKTPDLMAVLVPLAGTSGCDLKWVDDTHALAVFSNARIAAEMLSLNHPLISARPLSQASAESKQKARRSAQFLQPYKPRPETCTALAKRMVSSALGVRLKTTKEEREQEKLLLKEARERKRLAAKQSEEAWEGKVESLRKS